MRDIVGRLLESGESRLMPRPNQRQIWPWWIVGCVGAGAVALGLAICYSLEVQTWLPDEALPLGFALFAAASVVAVISLAAIIFPAAPIEDRMFEGIFGHALVGVAALIVAGGLYEHLKIEHRSARICTAFTPLGKGAQIPGEGQPYLLYVRDGAGSTTPLLEAEVPMTFNAREGKYCARVRYAKKLGFQFKIFVLYSPIPTGSEQTAIKDELCKAFLPATGNIYSDLKETNPSIKDYCEARAIDYHDQWRVWLILKEYGIIQEAHSVVKFNRNPDGSVSEDGGKQVWDVYWNNFYRPCALESTCPRE
jgi:hypothetical protein